MKKFYLILPLLPLALFAHSTTCDYALSFAGFNSYVSCGQAPSLHPESGLTVEAWIYTNDASQNQKIAGNIDPFTFSGYELAIDSGKLYCEVKDTIGVLNAFRAGSINSLEWTHVAFTFLVGGTMKGFINGIEVISMPVSATPIGNTGTTDFIMGAAPWDQNFFVFNGLIDEVRVFNTERPVDSIRKNMRIDISPLTSGLIGYWRFAEGVGTGTSDLSLSANNGTLAGSIAPAWTGAEGPYGNGVSNLQIATCCNPYFFTDAGFHMDVTSLSVTDTFVVSYIRCDPGGLQPTGSNAYAFGYWVIDRYGPAAPFSANYTFIVPPLSISTGDQAMPTNIKLYHRLSNSTSAWLNLASAVSASSATGEILFNAITNTGMFSIGTTGNSPLAISGSLDFLNELSPYPNPANDVVKICTSQPFKIDVIRIFAFDGRLVFEQRIRNQSEISIDVHNLTAGSYLIRGVGELNLMSRFEIIR